MLHTNGNTLFRLKSESQLYLIFAIIAFLISIIFYSLVKNFTLPYEFKIVDQIKLQAKTDFYFFRDYQNIGVEYKFRISQQTFDDYYKLEIFDNSNKVIDQQNFKGIVKPRYLSFHDFDNDGVDELLVFSTKNDSLFLTQLNLLEKKAILDEVLLLSGNKGGMEWDINYLTAETIDINGDGYKELIFGVRGGLSLEPRGIYVFDLQSKTFLNKFEFKAAFYDLKLFDIDKDGTKEIIVNTSATGNYTDENDDPIYSEYTDFLSWLFILNLDLSFKINPIKFTNYSSSIKVVTLNDKLAVVSLGYGEKPHGIYLFNNNGSIIKKIHEPNIRNVGQIKIGNDDFIICNYKNNSISLYDSKLKLINSKDFVWFVNKVDDNIKLGNQTASIFTFGRPAKGIVALDDDLNVIAKFTFETIIYYDYTKSNLKSIDLIRVRGKNDLFTIKLAKNTIHSYIHLLLFSIFILSLLLIISAHKLGKTVERRFKAYGFFINQNSKAILIVNHEGLIKSYNDSLIDFISNPALLKKNEFYGPFFLENPQLKKFVDNSIKSKLEHKKELAISIRNERKKIIATVHPIISFWGFPYAYIIELDDVTNPIMNERQKAWAQTSQKIAHDIKTPLSTIQLNLKALNQRVDKENFRNMDDFRDDLDMISSEVGRIRDLTKSFLQFANLEQPNLGKVSIQDVIERSLLQFRNYFSNRIRLETSFQNDDINVFADASQLEHLFHIIIENAIDSMNKDGIIEVKSAIRSESKNNSFVDIEITDNGIGINEDEINNIFDPYFTTKKDGNGMGLAIAKKITEDNNGEIKVYSKEGLGTTVTISFALVE